MIVAGKECGLLTTAQIQSCVPDGIFDKTQIAGIYAMLEQIGIKVIPPQEQGAEGWEREPTALPPGIDDEEEQIRSDLLRELLVFAPEQHEVDEALSEVCDELLESLTPLEAGLLRARFGMDGEKEQSFTELSNKYNFSVERLRQIEAKALRKLRHPSRSEKLRTFLEGEY